MRRLALGVGIALALAAAAVLMWVGPYVRDDLVLDRVVKAVALDWRDFGKQQAIERLEYELDHRKIGLHVPDDACRLVEAERLVVECTWGIEVSLPFSRFTLPLHFHSTAVVDRAASS